jgi:hypothetical protein
MTSDKRLILAEFSDVIKVSLSSNLVAQSIWTQYCSLSGQPDIFLGSGTEKKNQVQSMDLKKAGSKKQGHCYSKREEAAWPLLFLNKNDPVFSGSQTDPCFQNKNSGCKLTGGNVFNNNLWFLFHGSKYTPTPWLTLLLVL